MDLVRIIRAVPWIHDKIKMSNSCKFVGKTIFEPLKFKILIKNREWRRKSVPIADVVTEIVMPMPLVLRVVQGLLETNLKH